VRPPSAGGYPGPRIPDIRSGLLMVTLTGDVGCRAICPESPRLGPFTIWVDGQNVETSDLVGDLNSSRGNQFIDGRVWESCAGKERALRSEGLPVHFPPHDMRRTERVSDRRRNPSHGEFLLRPE
jgi:hypothetical protein